jgi:tetratricopeptide (TPR) repeat protein
MFKRWIKVFCTLIVFLATSSLLIVLAFFQSSVGSIIVTTNPSGAEIWLDEKLIAKTPAKLVDVPTGPHKIKLIKEGFYSLEQEVKVEEKYTTTLPMFALRSNKPVIETVTNIESSPSERIKEFRRLAEGAYMRGDYTFPTDNCAIYFNNAVLAINPNDKKAIELHKNIYESLSKQAEAAWNKGDLGTALSACSQIASYFPDDKDAVEALKNVKSKLASRRNMIPHLLRLGDLAFKNGRLISPSGSNAYYFTSQILAIEPNNPEALTLRLKVKEDLLRSAGDLISKDDLQGAIKLYGKILPLFPEDSRITSRIAVVSEQIEQQSNAAKREQ